MKKRTLSKRLALAILLLAPLLFSAEANALISSHQCVDCHSVMGASGSTLLNDASVEVLCMSCHATANGAAAAAEVHVNGIATDQAPFRHTCLDCHDAHDNMPNWRSATNIKLVGTRVDGSGFARIATPSSGLREVVFESRGSAVGQPTLRSFADGDEDNDGVWDGVCETCHTATANHQNSSAGDHSHYVGDTCTRCHSHGNGFNP